MKIRYFSDLHLDLIDKEVVNYYLEKITEDEEDAICICAGDIGSPRNNNYSIFMHYISKIFKKIFVIAGNHEYYNDTIEETNDFLENFFSKFDNITFLQNNFEYYEGYCFIGTTLWSNITDPIYKINDQKKIKNFSIDDYNKLHKKCLEFLIETLKNNNRCIIITHHIPSYKLMDDKYRTAEMDKYNQYFYSDLDYLFEDYSKKIHCWFYGHTHTPSLKQINNVLLLCNPIGYENENENINFDRHLIVG